MSDSEDPAPKAPETQPAPTTPPEAPPGGEAPKPYGNLLVPLLFSEVVNLHPVAIIVAVLFFGPSTCWSRIGTS